MPLVTLIYFLGESSEMVMTIWVSGIHPGPNSGAPEFDPEIYPLVAKQEHNTPIGLS